MKPKYSLFIGRYQPFHDGHEKLIRTVLNEGKRVCVALRDTPITATDPFNIEERTDMIVSRFEKEIACGQLKIIAIPDIEEVCYGRKVGWGIREIKLDAETENISATKIRENSNRILES